MRVGLSRLDREAMAQLVWATWGVQQDPPNDIAQRLIAFPSEAVTANLTSDHAIHAWELETLINLLVQVDRDQRLATLSCGRYEVIAQVVNLLRDLENTEAGGYINDDNIFNELHRIGQRQFPFQRGFLNSADFYRSVFLYGQSDCAAAFERIHGLSLGDFTKAGFALFSQFNRQPVVASFPDYSTIGVSPDAVERAVGMMSVDAAEAGVALQELLRRLDAHDQPTAYRPSLLRQRPILRFEDSKTRLRAPLPNLIALRISAGLYYDLLPGGRPVRDEIARQFERYCAKFLAAVTSELQVEPEYRYRRTGRGDQVDSPDLLATEDGRLALVIECKATKMTFGAQFSGDPVLAARDKYEELAKGVFQLWRFFSHCRRGLTRHTADPETFAILLTVDAWMAMSRQLQEQVLALARDKAAEDGDISEEDQRPVIFVAIQDFERLLLKTDLQGLKRTLAAASEERFLGWLLPDIGRDNLQNDDETRPYPFDLGDILPWWGELQAKRADHHE